MAEHAEWCAKTARPADPKLRGFEDTGHGSMRQVAEADCTCAANPTARLLRKLNARALESRESRPEKGA
jgi:hypothetical protein